MIGNICSLATIARLFLRFPAQKNDNMADSRKLLLRVKKEIKIERLWTGEEKEQLITSYEERKCLWTFTSIDEEMSQFDILKEDHKAKWKVLRSQFMREVLHYNNHNIDLNIGVVAIVKCSRKIWPASLVPTVQGQDQFESAHAPAVFHETSFLV